MGIDLDPASVDRLSTSADGPPKVGENFFLDEVGSVKVFVSVAPVSLAWKDRVGRFEVKLTQGLTVSLQRSTVGRSRVEHGPIGGLTSRGNRKSWFSSFTVVD